MLCFSVSVKIILYMIVILTKGLSDLPHWHLRQRVVICVRVQREQHQWTHQEGELRCAPPETRPLTHGHTQNTINAITLVTFSIGNIIGTEIFQPKDAPAYIPGKIAIMVLLTVQLFVSFLLRWINLRLNVKKRERLFWRGNEHSTDKEHKTLQK